nr:ATP-binding cassette domain-containing protein [Roseburia inulinivorans]
MIEISHLVKKYGDHIAVNDLTLTVEPGKIYGFLGPNGAGKSTTMNIITGYLGATSGEVKINGFDIFAQPEEAKKCVGISAGDPASLCGYDSQGVSELCGRVKETRKGSEK